MNITPEILSKFKEIIGDSYVFTDQETRNYYGKDETEAFVFPPSVVLKPDTPQEDSEILKIANPQKKFSLHKHKQ